MSSGGFLEPQLFFQSGAELCAAEDELEEEEMPATEKDLAEDAPWKKIQQNTFTRWCNEHLKVLNKRIADLQKDLSDGLKLIGLLEVLSQKKMYRKYHSRPNFRQMKLENVSVALEFLEREHIKLVSIGESCAAAALGELFTHVFTHSGGEVCPLMGLPFNHHSTLMQEKISSMEKKGFLSMKLNHYERKCYASL
uniref:Calponin-homology (CH) domain-containing protein n=1 Tax=Salarias fasciatus TaxID=181472 RepID=A0A672FPE1_SALFA